MASLTPEDQKKLGAQDYVCPKCGKREVKNYCRSCDEFFSTCGCPFTGEPRDDHSSHRTY